MFQKRGLTRCHTLNRTIIWPSVRGVLMNARVEYEKWLSYTGHEEDLVQDLQSIKDDNPEIEERFGRELQFGTGGLRGVIGAGLNRMNIHIVRRASLALAEYVLEQGPDYAKNGIVIGYDCRRKSKDFAKACGLVIAAAGVKAYVFPYLCPTPELSFTVRHLHAAAGVMITASHNPPEYNGYKVYGSDGGQVLPKPANRIRDLMTNTDNLFHIRTMALQDAQEQGLFEWVPENIRELYVEQVATALMSESLSEKDREGLRVVYTPLHGTGGVPVQKVLARAGYNNVFYVEEQMAPDGEFPTVKSPNPEESEALNMGIQLAKRINADIVLGTDPDSDRVGIAVRDAQGEYKLFTGNQVGALLVNFVLADRKSKGQLPENGIVFKTIVTSELGQVVASSYGVHTEDTLTGFKYIGDRIKQYEQTGEYHFLFGYEESYGYLVSAMVRDKDAVQTVLSILEMASFERKNGRTLVDALDGLFNQFGYHEEKLLSFSLPGSDGMQQMAALLSKLRNSPLTLHGVMLETVEDYLTRERKQYAQGKALSIEPLTLPKADVLKFFYSDGTWIAIRPSGTEPKLKAYIAVKGSNSDACSEKIALCSQTLKNALRLV